MASDLHGKCTTASIVGPVRGRRHTRQPDERRNRISGLPGAQHKVLLAATLIGLAGPAITVALLLLIKLGEAHYRSGHTGNSIAFTAFALCLTVATYECRSERRSVLTVGTFDGKQMNLAALAEFVLAVLVTQMDAFNRILGTTDINARQFGWALLAAVALLLWELGKLPARRSRS